MSRSSLVCGPAMAGLVGFSVRYQYALTPAITAAVAAIVMGAAMTSINSGSIRAALAWACAAVVRLY